MAPTIPRSRLVQTNDRPAALASERLREPWASVGVGDRDDLVRRVQVADVASAVIAGVLNALDRVDMDALEAPVDKDDSETTMLLVAVTGVPKRTAPDLAARVELPVDAVTRYARGFRILAAFSLHPDVARLPLTHAPAAGVAPHLSVAADA